VAEKNDVFQGVIGLESFGQIALLRSLVVSSDARGAGIGPALVTALEVACLANGVEELWLLTIDTDRFFEMLAYVTRDRADAPDVIQSTEEFRGLCPGDAVLMSKKLS
jgi:N-acetylglutamate synthase-like GNAT family acetyltransferase